MNQPKRIQRKRTKGWRMPKDAIAVGRPGYWGNPFAVSVFGVDLALRLYRDAILGVWDVSDLDVPHALAAMELRDAWLKRFNGEHPSEAVRGVLAGKDLACWCALEDKDGNRVPCHADVLLELANAEDV